MSGLLPEGQASVAVTYSLSDLLGTLIDQNQIFGNSLQRVFIDRFTDETVQSGLTNEVTALLALDGECYS